MYDFDTDICAYVPDWFRDIAEYQAICRTEREEFLALLSAMQQISKNFFFQTMDVGSVEMWEKIFRIIPNPVNESLEFRRARILNRISTRPPFTIRFLRQKLDQIIGEGKWAIDMDYAAQTLYIEAAASDAQYWGELAVTMNTIKPAHIAYVSRPSVTEGIELSETVSLAQLVYNYRLGAWGLGLKPFASIEEKGVIVTPNQRSIQQELLNDTASFVASDVASARVNGTIDISGLQKETTASTTVITYTVQESQAATVNKIELLDADGNVLTSAGVYVVVVGSALFKHTIPVTKKGVTA